MTYIEKSSCLRGRVAWPLGHGQFSLVRLRLSTKADNNVFGNHGNVGNLTQNKRLIGECRWQPWQALMATLAMFPIQLPVRNHRSSRFIQSKVRGRVRSLLGRVIVSMILKGLTAVSVGHLGFLVAASNKTGDLKAFFRRPQERHLAVSMITNGLAT
ncbi:MAG: hypothetical protein ABSD20_03810 [Terriglobales bacterium]